MPKMLALGKHIGAVPTAINIGFGRGGRSSLSSLDLRVCSGFKNYFFKNQIYFNYSAID
jgi:hypothetical protein